MVSFYFQRPIATGDETADDLLGVAEISQACKVADEVEGAVAPVVNTRLAGITPPDILGNCIKIMGYVQVTSDDELNAIFNPKQT
jgi:hypothetical protein